MADSGLDHAWRYFELHADQRMSLFNHFLILSGVVSAGLGATLQASGALLILAAGLGFLLVLVSFVFWKLDQRVAFLIKHAEAALSIIEGQQFEASARLFQTEPEAFNRIQASRSRILRHWTYGRSFRVVFLVMGLTGPIGAAISLAKYTGLISW